MQLAIYGAGSLGKQLYDVALRVNEQDRRWTDIFFIDDVRQERQFYLSRVHRLTEVGSVKILSQIHFIRQ